MRRLRSGPARAIAVALLGASALALSACASLAPYGPQTAPNGQGWSEQRIETNRWRVAYRGVGDPRPVADYALLRAAELTLAQGHDWFEVTQSWSDGRPNAAGGVRPGVSIGASTGGWGGYRSSGVGVGVGLDFSGPQPTSTQIEIVTGRGERPDRPDAYDARAVAAAISRGPG